MAVAYVQSWTANGGGIGASSNTLTVSGATANNLLVGHIAIRTSVAAGTWTTPSGWTLISNALGSGVGGAFYYRIASGTAADNFAGDWGISKRWVMSVLEYSGLATSSVFETSNENESQLASTTRTLTTGSITPATAGLAIAAYNMDADTSKVGSWDATDVEIDSGFTFRLVYGDPVNLRPVLAFAELDLSSTSAVNPQWNWDSTTSAIASGSYAAIASFAEAGGGGFQPAWTRGANVMIGGAP